MDSVRVKLKISPLTPELWPALEDLFGKAGACNGCWCLYWRIGSEYHKRPRERNRVAFKRIVERGPSPGLIAFDGERAVGWCQLTARDELRWLQRARFFERVDDQAVWSISCFYVRRGYRNRGVMSALIAAAVKEATRAKVRVLEAYPVDTERPDSTRNVFTGTKSAFERCGFRTVGGRVVSRPIMRRELRSRGG
jgi:GNAT superfamily N-acetyltransferase